MVVHFKDASKLAQLWWFSFMWILIIGILFVSWRLAYDFLTTDVFLTSLFYWGWVVIITLYPFYLLGITLYTFYFIYKEREVQKLINRGIDLTGRKGFK